VVPHLSPRFETAWHPTNSLRAPPSRERGWEGAAISTIGIPIETARHRVEVRRPRSHRRGAAVWSDRAFHHLVPDRDSARNPVEGSPPRSPCGERGWQRTAVILTPSGSRSKSPGIVEVQRRAPPSRGHG